MDVLHALLSLPEEERIKAVWEDVASRRDIHLKAPYDDQDGKFTDLTN